VYDREFARHLTHVFEQDLQRCKRVTLQDWQQRPALEKARERLAALLSPVL
jgi:cardiolipin synthase A/B